jgi:H2-forming N5,N10-methylenetetrahydromethanopterin dehydrogenase-like enzyme
VTFVEGHDNDKDEEVDDFGVDITDDDAAAAVAAPMAPPG